MVASCLSCSKETKIYARGKCVNCSKREYRKTLSPEAKKIISEKKCALIKLRRKELSEMIDKIKLDSGCVDCGYNKHPKALDFDHVRGVKVKDIAKYRRSCSSTETLMNEIAKCEVRCANCHRIETYNRRLLITHSD